MSRIFGTDGVRGKANQELTAELALKLGRALGLYLQRKFDSPQIILGKDPRISSDMLEMALAAGVLSAGVKVELTGIITTPALSYLVREHKAQAGAMISASHNPIEDNGIKIFSSNGIKLPDEEEEEIEGLLSNLSFNGPLFPARPDFLKEASALYLRFLMDNAPGPLPPLDLVLDCAFGSTSLFAPQVFSSLGLRVHALNAVPDGWRINVNCGSTNPDFLRQEVLCRHADLGFAFDGDGDRLIACDRQGRIVNGDIILCAWGLHLLRQQRLPHNIIVATQMSNYGLERALAREGGKLISVKVGDRYVLEKMVEEGAIIGGEQSGHIIFRQILPAGDGILTGLMLLRLMKETGKDLSELGQEYEPFPQLLVNVRVGQKEKLASDSEVQRAIKEWEEQLAGKGRIVVRPSGTEPLIRIMVEASEEELAKKAVDSLAEVISTRLGV